MWVSFSYLRFFWLVFHHNRCVITANTLPLQPDVASFETSVLWNQWYWVKVNEDLEASLQMLLDKGCGALWGSNRRHVAWFHSLESAEMSPSSLGFFMGKRMPYISPCTHLPTYTRLLLVHSFVPWFNECLLSTYLSTEKKYVQPESWELCLIQWTFWGLKSPGHGISENSGKLFGRGKGCRVRGQGEARI